MEIMERWRAGYLKPLVEAKVKALFTYFKGDP